MKVLIPTNDCLTVAPDFENAKAFRLLTIINGSVKEDSLLSIDDDSENKLPFGLKELCGNDLVEIKLISTPDHENKNHTNRQIAIALEISAEAEMNLHNFNYEVFHTEETNIINALTYFLKNHVTMDSDYCCCP
jgi:hypothetical protein